MSNTLEMAKDIFGGQKFAEAKARIDGNYERAGHYYNRIDRIKLTETRSNGVGLFVEKTVIAVLDDDEGKGHKVGESITHCMLKKHDSFLGNVKAFVAGVFGLASEQVTEDHVYQVVDDDQPLSGTVVENKNRVILTKNKQQPFTVINYIREVPAAELLEVLPADIKQAFFPNGHLEAIAAFEEEQAAKS